MYVCVCVCVWQKEYVFSIPYRGRGTYPSFPILSVLFCGQPGQQSRLFCKFSFFCVWIIIKSGLLPGIRWSVCILKSHKSLCVAFSRTCAGLCIYHLLVWSNLNFLHISQWITLATQSCLALYSLCANLLHSLIIWMMVSSLSPHNLHLLFCWVLSILALIWLVLMALSCAAIRRDSVSIIIIIIYSFRVFHINVSGWSFTRVWVTVCLLKSPGLFSVFWPFSIIL